MAGVRISHEKGLVLRAGAPLGNPGNQSQIFIHGFQLQLLRKSCHFGHFVWGALQDPPRRVRPVGPAYLHTREKDARYSLTGVAYGVARTHSGFVDPSSSREIRVFCGGKFTLVRLAYLHTAVFPGMGVGPGFSFSWRTFRSLDRGGVRHGAVYFFPEWASAQGSLCVGGPSGLDRPRV